MNLFMSPKLNNYMSLHEKLYIKRKTRTKIWENQIKLMLRNIQKTLINRIKQNGNWELISITK